jgi:hypothetical protein
MRTTPSTAIDDARLPLCMMRQPSARKGQETARQAPGSYRLPHDIAERLATSLAAYRTRERAMALALFLARFWSSRTRMARPFPIDRRALADHDALGLTEAQVRGALRTLEEVGFLLRAEPLGGSRYKPTPDGLHRKPILYGFGKDYGPAFAAANARAERARDRAGAKPGAIAGRARTPNPSTARPARPFPNSPKNIDPRRGQVIMGDRVRAGGMMRVAEPTASRSALEDALQRLGGAAGFSFAVPDSVTR